ncbi:uncharacterized protein LOC128990734 [Macrosteles quadrilineatus]|uniref:uncharacterized protein LOC128990734 n=1 Tax=Macrosteles quadrilineatus TaxID=74068 RepID=UPI0023E296AB|nr:uncharacterized protein LOC128990734 [Macrosteles quadrilineatus]
MQVKSILCVILSCVFSTRAALWMDGVYELARKCIRLAEVNGTEDDVTDLLMGYLPDTRSGKCMLKCMQEHVGILVNGTYDLKGTYLFFRNTFPENPFHKNMERAVRFCGKIVEKRRSEDMDPCQYAHMVAACVKRRIRFRPGCRSAFYNPFKWKDPSKRVTIKPGKKYFVPDPRFMQKVEFEIITRPTRKYTLGDLNTTLASGESVEAGAYVWTPPKKTRKGKWGRRQKEEMREKKKKAKEAENGSVSGMDISEDDETLEKSSKTRRHKKDFVI